jgi:hypothetical protein
MDYIAKSLDENVNKISKQIDNYIKNKGSTSLVFSSKTTDWTTQISPPIVLDNKDNYEVGLIDLETYYSFYNITSVNNKFAYFNGTTNQIITLLPGIYSIIDINAAIQSAMQTLGDWNSGTQTYYITILINNTTLGSVVNITNPAYTVDFTILNSLANLLGFNPLVLTSGYNISPNIVNILTVNSILVNCNIISGSYSGGIHSTVLYSYFPSVGPGYKIIQTPINVVYLPLIGDHIQSVRFWITDQNGNILDFNTEETTLRIKIQRKV